MSLQSTIEDLFKPPSKLQKMVDRAVGIERSSPDLVLNLDICDLVNQKKGNFPHDAVFALLPYVNGSSNRQANLALTLLDNLIKNCGHPVHYQIASRDFLNELFRRFPEFQPSIPNPVHYRILEMLQEWRVSLCRRSRYKEDLQRINDMYNLLRRKGWRFPEIETDNVAVMLEPEDTLKSREQLEKEDLEAMQAKLQELLRRATPRDLREANKLMKVITGYEESPKQRDYDKEWEDELQGIENRAKLLLEMLQETKPGTQLDETARDLLAKCMSSQSRLQKLISEHDGLSQKEEVSEEEKFEFERLIRLNDIIGEAIQASHDIEEGKQHEFKNSYAGDKGTNELIIWDEEDSENGQSATAAATSGKPANFLDDLAGLDFDSSNSITSSTTAGGSIALPMSPSGGSLSSKSMTNPSLPANSQQARLIKHSGDTKQDVFDFSAILSAAKSVGGGNNSNSSSRANVARTTSWGSSPDASTTGQKDNKEGGSGGGGGGSLIDFMS